MLAAYHGHAETVRMLVERGADVDLRNNRNQAPVAGALFKGEDEVVRLLVGAGADLDAGTPTGRDAAAMFDRLDLLERLEKWRSPAQSVTDSPGAISARRPIRPSRTIASPSPRCSQLSASLSGTKLPLPCWSITSP